MTVDKTLTDQDGRSLKHGKSWQFATQRAELHPMSGGFDSSGSCVLMSFNQPMQPTSILAKTHMSVGEEKIPLRFATESELEILIGPKEAENFYCLVPDRELPQNSNGVVVIEAGIAAIEGPLPSVNSFERSIHTMGQTLVCSSPEQISKVDDAPWVIEFDGPRNTEHPNVLDVSSITTDMFQISPTLPDCKITTSEGKIFIRGSAKPDTEYTLKIDASLPGALSPLGKTIERTLLCTKTTVPKIFNLPSSFYVVTDRGVQNNLHIYSSGTDEVIVSVFNIESLLHSESIPADLSRLASTRIYGQNPVLQKHMKCNPYKENIKVSELNLDFLRNLGGNQFALALSTPGANLLQVEGPSIHDFRRGRRLFNTFGSDTVPVEENSQLPNVSQVVLVQIAPFNASSLISNTSTKVLCTDLLTGKPTDAKSVTAAPNVSFVRVRKGEFELPTPVLERQMVRIDESMVPLKSVALPNALSGFLDGNYSYQNPKLCVFCTGEFENVTAQKPIHFAGFISTTNSDGLRNCAPTGKLKYHVQDSDGNSIGKGETIVADGLFEGEVAISEAAKTGEGKIDFSYTCSSDTLTQKFSAAIKIPTASPITNRAFICTPSGQSYGLPPKGRLTVLSNLVPRSEAEKCYWNAYAEYANFAPQGWNDFRFGNHLENSERLQGFNFRDEDISASKTSDKATFDYKNTSDAPVSINFCITKEFDSNKEFERHSFVVQPAKMLIGLKTKSYAQNDLLNIDTECVVTDLDGHAIGNRSIDMQLLTLEKAPTTSTQFDELEKISLVSSLKKPVGHKFKVKNQSKRLVLIATVKDNDAQTSRTTIDASLPIQTFNLAAAGAAPLTISTNKSTYKVGENCTLIFKESMKAANGFVAVATPTGIAAFPTSVKRGAKQVSFKIPPTTNGQLTGLIKLFEDGTGRHEAEGPFRVDVEDDRRILRLNLSAEKSQDDREHLEITVVDEHLTPAANANVILMAYADDRTKEFDRFKKYNLVDENFHLLMNNPIKTNLVASSLTRAPRPSLKPDAIKPNRDPSGASFSVDSFISRTSNELAAFLPAKPLFLKALHTDESGKASFDYKSDQNEANLLVKAFVMTKAGDGYECTSTFVPSPSSSEAGASIDSAGAISDAQATTADQNVITSKAQGFHNFNFLDSKCAPLSGITTVLPTETASPMSVIVSNSKLASLAVSAERLLAQTCSTTDARTSRLITLLSLLPFTRDEQTKTLYEKAINDDIYQLCKSDNFTPAQNMGWIPANSNSIGTPELESQYTAPLMMDALMLAKSRGYLNWKDFTQWWAGSVAPELNRMYDLKSFADKINGTAYSVYIGEKARRTLSSLKSSFILDSITQKLAWLPPEAVAWLIVPRNELQLDSVAVRVLEQRLEHDVEQELRFGVAPIGERVKQLRLLSAMLTAMNHYKPQSEYTTSLVDKLSLLLDEDECLYADVERSFAAAALCRYYDLHRSAATSGTAKLVTQAGKIQDFSFTNDSPSVCVFRNQTPSVATAISGSNDLIFGTISKLRNTQSNIHGIAVKREFSALNEKNSCTIDQHGNWHCKKGTPIKVRIEFTPTEKSERIILQSPIEKSERVEKETLPQANIYAPLAPGDNYWKTWVQNVSQSGESLFAYGSRLAPGKYEFEYQTIFSEDGVMKLPKVTVYNPYSQNIYGQSNEQTMIVSP